MPRPPRIMSSSGIYHIVLRSVNQQLIFEEESDYLKFLYILSDCKVLYDIDIYAYCLMDNHIHLLLHSSPESLAGFFQSVGARFVLWYNKKYLRNGHLFQDRFHSRVVDNQSYFLNTLIYIHNNPVKAGICSSPSEYRWSSFLAYYGKENTMVDVSFSEKILGSASNVRQYFSDHCNDETIDSEEFDITSGSGRKCLTDEDAISAFRSITGNIPRVEIYGMPKKERNELTLKLYGQGFTQKQIGRLLGISRGTVIRILKNDTQPPSPSTKNGG